MLDKTRIWKDNYSLILDHLVPYVSRTLAAMVLLTIYEFPSSKRKVFNNLCHLIVEKWSVKQMHIFTLLGINTAWNKFNASFRENMLLLCCEQGADCFQSIERNSRYTHLPHVIILLQTSYYTFPNAALSYHLVYDQIIVHIIVPLLFICAPYVQ